MQNRKGKGGMAIAIKENLRRHTQKKVERINEKITIMHIKTQIQGKTMVVMNTHAQDVSTAIDIREI